MVAVALRADLGICLPSSPPFGESSSVAENEYNEMIDTSWVRVQCIDKIARKLGGAFSDGALSITIKCVACRQEM